MELKDLYAKIGAYIKKYKFVLLILLIGLVFMLMPTEKKEKISVHQQSDTNKTTQAITEEKLATILRKIHGVGEVAVMLTEAYGEETIYQTNEKVSTAESNSDKNTDTVTVSDSQRNEAGLIRQINPVQYKGALIVCSGAGDPSVKLSVVEAVSKITGLTSNQISVLKMK